METYSVWWNHYDISKHGIDQLAAYRRRRVI